MKPNAYAAACPTRQILDRVGDKWAVLILLLIREEPMRFNALRRAIEGISQKMLSQVLKSLERDGLIRRRAIATVPVTVEYSITPLGKTLESIDHERMSNAVFPALLAMKAAGASAQGLENAITAAADGYAFPVNLDRDQPIGGLTPDCQADVLRRAVVEQWDADKLRAELRSYAYRRLSVGDLPA